MSSVNRTANTWIRNIRIGLSILLFTPLAITLVGSRIGLGRMATSMQSSDVSWHSTGITLPANYLEQNSICFDATQPNVILVQNDERGATAYNWITDQQYVVNRLPYRFCSGIKPEQVNMGLEQEHTTGSFKLLPDPLPEELQTNYTAQNGKQVVYSLARGHLKITTDTGVTWDERAQQFGGNIAGIAISNPDASALYAMVTQPLTADGSEPYAIYFSSDAGVKWIQRYTNKASSFGSSPPSIVIESLLGAPVGVLLMKINTGGAASGGHTDLLLSGDGANTFVSVGRRSDSSSAQLVYTNEGLVRLADDESTNPTLSLGLSTDSGQSWQQLSLPQGIAQQATRLAVSRSAGDSLFLSQGTGTLWYSPDGGHTWEQFSDYTTTGPLEPVAIHLTPYLPLTVLGIHDSQLYVLQLPDAGKSLSGRTLPNGSQDGNYFQETGHNLSGAFKKYWDTNGNLAQNGFPVTEPFWETSDTNGKLYLVQYFERAVMEYHPGNQAPYDVLLSLLGNFLYKEKYPNGALNQTVDEQPGNRFFPETTKHLGGPFLDYWKSHGELAQQGYPISEEFDEISTLDGKTYKVQYFERAVFELHPENNGTPHEVLLSQLGTFRLREKYGSELP